MAFTRVPVPPPQMARRLHPALVVAACLAALAASPAAAQVPASLASPGAPYALQGAFIVSDNQQVLDDTLPASVAAGFSSGGQYTAVTSTNEGAAVGTETGKGGGGVGCCIVKPLHLGGPRARAGRPQRLPPPPLAGVFTSFECGEANGTYTAIIVVNATAPNGTSEWGSGNWPTLRTVPALHAPHESAPPPAQPYRSLQHALLRGRRGVRLCHLLVRCWAGRQAGDRTPKGRLG